MKEQTLIKFKNPLPLHYPVILSTQNDGDPLYQSPTNVKAIVPKDVAYRLSWFTIVEKMARIIIKTKIKNQK